MIVRAARIWWRGWRVRLRMAFEPSFVFHKLRGLRFFRALRLVFFRAMCPAGSGDNYDEHADGRGGGENGHFRGCPRRKDGGGNAHLPGGL